MKIFSAFLFFAALQLQPAVARTEVLSDVFPLAIGSQWTYDFDFYHQYSFIGRTWSHDTGNVNYEVVGMEYSADSTVWQFFQRRIYMHATIDFPQPTLVRDSSAFSIVELHSGGHELYTLQTSEEAVFNIPKATTDSQKVFRFVATDSLGNASQYTVFPPPVSFCPPTRRSYAMRNQMGTTRFIGGNDSCYVTTEARYYLAGLVSVPPNPPIRLPFEARLLQNYPNPFNPSTTIDYHIATRSQVVLSVFDVLGREVSSLVNAIQEPGYKSVQWDAANVASGLYFYQLRAGPLVETKKMFLVR